MLDVGQRRTAGGHGADDLEPLGRGDPPHVQRAGTGVVVDDEHADRRRHGATAISTSIRAPPRDADLPTTHRAAAVGRRASHDREADAPTEARVVGLRRPPVPEHPVGVSRVDAGAVVLDRDRHRVAPADGPPTAGGAAHPCRTSLGRVAAEVRDDEQHLVVEHDVVGDPQFERRSVRVDLGAHRLDRGGRHGAATRGPGAATARQPRRDRVDVRQRVRPVALRHESAHDVQARPELVRLLAQRVGRPPDLAALRVDRVRTTEPARDPDRQEHAREGRHEEGARAPRQQRAERPGTVGCDRRLQHADRDDPGHAAGVVRDRHLRAQGRAGRPGLGADEPFAREHGCDRGLDELAALRRVGWVMRTPSSSVTTTYDTPEAPSTREAIGWSDAVADASPSASASAPGAPLSTTDATMARTSGRAARLDATPDTWSTTDARMLCSCTATATPVVTPVAASTMTLGRASTATRPSRVTDGRRTVAPSPVVVSVNEHNSAAGHRSGRRLPSYFSTCDTTTCAGGSHP